MKLFNSAPPKLSGNLIRAYSKDEKPFVRALAASNHYISNKMLTRLAKDKAATVRRAVVANPKVTETILRQMIQTELVRDIWAAIMRKLHPNTPGTHD